MPKSRDIYSHLQPHFLRASPCLTSFYWSKIESCSPYFVVHNSNLYKIWQSSLTQVLYQYHRGEFVKNPLFEFHMNLFPFVRHPSVADKSSLYCLKAFCISPPGKLHVLNEANKYSMNQMNRPLGQSRDSCRGKESGYGLRHNKAGQVSFVAMGTREMPCPKGTLGSLGHVYFCWPREVWYLAFRVKMFGNWLCCAFDFQFSFSNLLLFKLHFTCWGMFLCMPFPDLYSKCLNCCEYI